jgi:4-amino-4-deoxy-L-arabinose transferase-like glycosyltransferase
MVLISLGVFAFSWGLGLFTWRVLNPFYAFQANGILRLLVWFGWPAWPLALWSLWRWRHQLSHWRWPTHLAMPLGFVAISLFSACTTQPADRALLLGLPALCALASFALPTLNRRLSALIDWFTLLFFALLALLIWFYWFAAVTGSPAAAAAAVARRTPGFTPHWVWQEFCLALVATLAYAWLLAWRIGRHRSALWKSLVLPAGGTVLAWVLFMTLWLPALNYALSYEPMVKQARQWMGLPSQSNQTQCVEQDGLTRAQIAAFQYYAPLRLVPVQDNPERSPPSDSMGASCAWRLTSLSHVVDSPEWQSVGLLQRPTDRFDQLVLFRRKVPAAPVYAAASAPL